MKRFSKTTILISLSTVILAGVAVFTAMRLYQLRNESVSPAAPESEPGAQQLTCGGISGAACPEGYSCQYEGGSSFPPFPDATGTCVTLGAGEGETCGGIRGTQCAKGLTCLYNGSAFPPNPDATGICTAQTSKTTCEDIVFTLGETQTPTPTATATGTSSPTPTATPTVTSTATPTSPGQTPTPPGQTPTPPGQTPTSTPIGQAPTPTSTSLAGPAAPGTTSTPTASLPPAGYATPTVVGIGAGLVILVFSILLAL